MDKIFIGNCDKEKIIKEYTQKNSIKKIFIIGEKINIDYDEYITFKDTIEYKPYFHWLSIINDECLVILNESLKHQNRYLLNYNCIRRYCERTKHVIIFNFFPIIEHKQDFMILYDMILPNKFLKEKYEYVTKFNFVKFCDLNIEIKKTEIVFEQKIIDLYENEKQKILKQVNKDPDILPRRLLKFSEKYKNKIATFDSLSERKEKMNVCLSNLKVDNYYYSELLRWKKDIEDVKHKI